MNEHDYTPLNFELGKKSFKDSIKAFLRLLLYPFWLKLNHYYVKSNFSSFNTLGFDRVVVGQRGSDYYSLRKKLNSFRKIKGKRILVIGCGHGQDIESWVRWLPSEVVAVDYNNYRTAWQMRSDFLKKKYNVPVTFLQVNVEDMSIFDDASFDFVCSDAVYEHLKKFSTVLAEIKRVLRPRGVMYATFGPLWHTFGGDIVSGSRRVEEGYNHLVLNSEMYKKFIEEVLKPSDYRRFYFENGFFSYLKFYEYIDLIQAQGFSKLHLAGVVSTRGVGYKKMCSDSYMKLLQSYTESELLLESLSLIYEKN